MSDMERPEHLPSRFRRADAVFNLAQTPGVEHLIDSETGYQYLQIDESVVYPNADDTFTLQDVLLERSPDFSNGDGNKTYLLLPDNYATMAQALNDAIGQSATNTSREVVYDLFGELGSVLGRVAQHDQLVPQSLDYRRVLFLRDVIGVKLLPPLAMERFMDKEVAQRKVIASLWRTCVQGASNAPQKNQLPQAFRGFVIGFTW